MVLKVKQKETTICCVPELRHTHFCKGAFVLAIADDLSHFAEYGLDEGDGTSPLNTSKDDA